MNCKKHGSGLPCWYCLKEEYSYCVKDNKIRKEKNLPLDENGQLLLHDTKSLLAQIREREPSFEEQF